MDEPQFLLINETIFLTHYYHKFESQSYGILWHDLVAAFSLTFITVARVRWRSQRVTDRTRVAQTCLCRVWRAFGREMAMRERCTTSRANDLATLLSLRHDCNSQNISSTMSLKCSTSFEVDVEHHLTVWCWRFFLFFFCFDEKKRTRKGKMEKL